MNSRVVIVLGMHRSGTSALSRGLRVLGVEQGQLGAITPDNPRGHWEHPQIVAFNERLLGALGCRWDTVASIDATRWHTPAVATLAEEAAALVAGLFGDHALWGFKDPRTARLLPFWQRVLRELGCDDRYVIACRHPRSVAQSLAARDGFRAEHAHLLWLQHVLPSLQHTAGRPRVVVDYDVLV